MPPVVVMIMVVMVMVMMMIVMMRVVMVVVMILGDDQRLFIRRGVGGRPFILYP